MVPSVAFSAHFRKGSPPTQTKRFTGGELITVLLRQRLRIYACDTYEPLALKRTTVEGIRVIVAGVDEVFRRLAGAQQ